MKRIILVVAVLVGCLMFKSADAQLRISLGLNIGSQPDWGPTGYDHAEYYYMPDIDAYYDVPNHQYVYSQNNVWVHAGALPPRYSNYDLYNGYKVVVNDRNPWERAATYRAKYASFKGHRGQQAIRDSRDQKYRNHWNGNNGHGNNGHDNNNGHSNNGHGNNGHDDNGHGGHDDHGHDDNGHH
ncbi:MAG: hypothetical protein JWQ79_10 [Mucilaginibacter sp.]|nr:hypothetical protein [Mucilaginibacter sp.]